MVNGIFVAVVLRISACAHQSVFILDVSQPLELHKRSELRVKDDIKHVNDVLEMW